MRKPYYLIICTIFLSLSIQTMLAQEKIPLSFRFHLQPQVSSLNPYDQGFISTESKVFPSFAFGIEVSRNLSKQLEISLGYQYSSQAGNFSLVSCDFAANESFFARAGNRINPRCPLPRGKIRITKIPISLGWRIIQNEKFMSKVSFGPQIQILFNPPTWGLYNYKKTSVAFMTEWSNYFKISTNISLVAGLRADRSITTMDHNSLDRAIGNSFGLVVGAEYTIWTEGK